MTGAVGMTGGVRGMTGVAGVRCSAQPRAYPAKFASLVRAPFVGDERG